MTAPRQIGGLAEIADGFDAMLFDQFGVLHDGRRAFPGAVTVLEALAERGIPVAVLSNSGKRAAANAARFGALGFHARLFGHVVTSGELARAELELRLAQGSLAPGAAVSLIARGGDGGLFDGLALRPVPPGPETTLLIIAGTEPERIARDDLAAALAPLAARGVPALCINPDREIYIEGGSGYGPGALAETYRSAGGPLRVLGKPGAEMFRAGLAALGAPDPAKVLMVGDSPEHDIAGARAAGCATLLVAGGVQAGLAGGAFADFVIDRLVWRARDTKAI
ncbi:MAG: TIGR01459 family HAD-type hydrolase [Pseudomonadota bacterium]